MKARSTLKLMALVCLVLLQFSGLATARPVHTNVRQNVQITDFYKALAPYGTWVNHRTYGKVWYPNGVDENWRPYTDGYWAHTEEYGWLWVANEVWGWAPYHYGRWAWDKWYGWIWVPGNTWAPAWVLWRSGGGYVAWAPMPPNVVWQPNVGLNTRYFNYDRDMFVGSWVAVHDYDLPNRYLSRRVFTPRHTIQIFHSTNYINNYITIINRTIVNKGVPIRHIEKAIGKPITPVKPIVVRDIDPPSTATRPHEREVPTIVQPNVIMAGGSDANKEIELAQKLNANPAEITAPTVGTADTQPLIPGRLTGGPEPSPVQAVVPPTSADMQSAQPIGQEPAITPQNPVTIGAPIPSAAPAIIQADPNAPCPVGSNCVPQSGQIPMPTDSPIPSAVEPEMPVQTPITASPVTIDPVPTPLPAETLPPALDNATVPLQLAEPPSSPAITSGSEITTPITPADNGINPIDSGTSIQPPTPVETQQPTSLANPEPITPINIQEPIPVYQQEMPAPSESSQVASPDIQPSIPEPVPSEPANSLVNTTPPDSAESSATPIQSAMPVEAPQPAAIETSPEPPPPSSAPEPAPVYQPEPVPAPQPEPVAAPDPQPEPTPPPQAQPEPPPAPTPEPPPAPVQEAPDKKDEKPTQN